MSRPYRGRARREPLQRRGARRSRRPRTGDLRALGSAAHPRRRSGPSRRTRRRRSTTCACGQAHPRDLREGPLRGRHVGVPRRERGHLGAGRPAAPRRRGPEARLGGDRRRAARALHRAPRLRAGHRRARAVAAHGRGRDPARRARARAAAVAGRPPARRGAGERRQPDLELMWGSPGTMLAADAMHERTGDDRWAQAWRASADRLWDAWDGDLWLQDLYGRAVHHLGPAHGCAGNVLVLWRGPPPARRRDGARSSSAGSSRPTLRHAGARTDRAQWPPALEPPLNPRSPIRTQWCHGAPGMVASLAPIAPGDDALTDVLIAGGELTWKAGPLTKGAGLCHGTAGNGYAFLKLLQRTGDEQWLHRARAFASTRHRAGHEGESRAPPGPPHPLDRRPRNRLLPPELPRRHGSRPNPRRPLSERSGMHEAARGQGAVPEAPPLTRGAPQAPRDPRITPRFRRRRGLRP